MLIKHGEINAETIYTKKTSKGLEVKIGSFDVATMFEHDIRKKRVMSELKPMTSRKFAQQVDDQ